MEYEIKLPKELDEFQQKIKAIEKKNPQLLYSGMDRIGNKVKKEIQEVTPVGKTGNLKKGWKRERTEKVFGVYETKLRSTARHYHLVERGHRVVLPGKGKSRRAAKGDRVGNSLSTFIPRDQEGNTWSTFVPRGGRTFVAGRFFFEKKINTLEPYVYREEEKLLKRIMKRLNK